MSPNDAPRPLGRQDIYRPLTNGSVIRVFDLYPLQQDGVVRGRLRRVDLDKRCKYTAMSYTWGPYDPASDRTIQISGIPFKVRKNLWEALISINTSKSIPADDSLVLWIDAICIDQERLRERNHQVDLMARIFQTAQNVLIYLGPSNNSLEIFVQSNSETSQTSQTVHQQRRSSPRHLLSSLNELCERDYWSRVWIVQELGLARRICVLIGRLLMSWATFGNLVLAHRNELSLSPGCFLIDWRQREQPRAGSLDAEALLQKFPAQKCADPRDKLFGYLGLIRGGDHFAVDYSMSRTAIMHAALQYFRPAIGLHNFARVLLETLDVSRQAYLRELRELNASDLCSRRLTERDVRIREQADATHRPRIVSFRLVMTNTTLLAPLFFDWPVNRVLICQCPSCGSHLSYLTSRRFARLLRQDRLIIRRLKTLRHSFIVYTEAESEEGLFLPLACADLHAPDLAKLNPDALNFDGTENVLLLYAMPPEVHAKPLRLPAHVSAYGTSSTTMVIKEDIRISAGLLHKCLWVSVHPWDRNSFKAEASTQDDWLSTRETSWVSDSYGRCVYPPFQA